MLKDPTELPTEIEPRLGPGSRRLVVVWSGGRIERALPERGTLVIGRGDADLRVDHTSVSRRHAELTIGPQSITVRDLGSANGVWIDGKKLEPRGAADIVPGTLVELGSVLVVVRGGTDVTANLTQEATTSPAGVFIADEAMREVHRLVELVARSNLSVMLLGETGVGKDVLANRIHACSPRARMPLLKINCAALTETLLEAELFGYERGAFTGAVQTKQGIIEAANGGTVFLDEVGDMPASSQAKLLRVLESGEVTRIGNVKPIKVDVRYVSATHRDFRTLVAQGTFREDLLFRLDGLSIIVPPLRARPSEVPGLVRHFVDEACRANGRPPMAVTDAAMARLCEYSWPGNVRELRNAIARSVLLAPGPALEAGDLRLQTAVESSGRVADALRSRPSPSGGSPSQIPPSSGISAAERARILAALQEAGGNQTRAAKILGIARRTLINRLDELGLPRPRKGLEDDDE